MKYDVQLSAMAAKQLKRIDKPMQKRIAAKIDRLRVNPRPPGYIELKGTKDARYRVRVGDYRILYKVDRRCSLDPRS